MSVICDIVILMQHGGHLGECLEETVLNTFCLILSAVTKGGKKGSVLGIS